MAEEVEDECKGSDQKNELDPKPIEKEGHRTKKGCTCGRVKKSRAGQVKARTRTWLDVVKGLKTEEELETTDLVDWFDSNEPNYIKNKWMKGQPKLTSKQRNHRLANISMDEF